MINHNTSFDHNENQSANTIKELGIGNILRKSNIKKAFGISAYEVYQFLLLFDFNERTYYRFLNEASYNWRRFLLLLSVKVTAAFHSLTRPERVNVCIF